MIFVGEDAPEADRNPQYHAPRIVVRASNDETLTLRLESLQGRDHDLEVVRESEEEYGPQEPVRSLLYTTVEGDLIWLTSYITDAMSLALRQFEERELETA